MRPLVGNSVCVRSSGRKGELVIDDGSELPFKVKFNDGIAPEADWYSSDAIRIAEEQPEAITAELSCPICFTGKADCIAPVVTPCGHTFCAACIEHVIDRGQGDDPTQAACPMCRTEVSLFDLCAEKTGEKLHSLSSDLTALVGCVFIQRRSHGIGSFHFEDANSAYISYEKNQNLLRLDDDSPLPARKDFEDALWHAPTRTFHAVVNWSPVSFLRSHKWKYVIQFSQDLRYVSGGSIKMQPMDRDTKLDGMWKVEGERSLDEPVNIVVEGGSFLWHNKTSSIDMTERGRVSITMPSPSPYFAATSHVADLDVASVQQVGSSITWQTQTNGFDHSMCWTRIESASSTAPPARVQPFGPEGLQYSRFSGEGETQPPPQLCTGSIWGNVFIQGFKLGLASYHFLPRTGDCPEGNRAYISYEHPDCDYWPELDNGAPLPERVPFTEVEWNASERRFAGVINWVSSFGTTWEGIERWQYEMIFDADFMYIASGTCRQFMIGGAESPELHHFGDHLAYINAAAEQEFSAKKEQGETWDAVRSNYASAGVGFRILSSLRVAWGA